jgi:hypothetical protein
MQESKYRDAIRYYQPLIARNANNLLGVTAIVLANLCVSYIMTSQVRLLSVSEGVGLVQMSRVQQGGGFYIIKLGTPP